MKVTIQRPTAEGVRYITLPDNVLKLMGWKVGEIIYLEPFADKQGKISHVILEKR